MVGMVGELGMGERESAEEKEGSATGRDLVVARRKGKQVV